MGKISIRIGDVHPSVKVEWLLASVFMGVTDCSLLGLEVTDTFLLEVWNDTKPC